MKLCNKIKYLVVFIVSITLFMPSLKAASYNSYSVRYKCPVRVDASEKAESIKSGNDTVYVYPEQEVNFLENKLGPNNGKENQTWYKVKFDYAAREYTGYVAKACMYDVKTYSYNDDTAFEESIKNFPESYKPYLRMLHAKHPNWVFVSDNTNLKWEDAAEAESQKGTSAISHLYPSLIFKDEANPNGIVVDGYNWYAPAKDAVKYYMDPRNFLNEKGIFMFESLSYNSNGDQSVQSVLQGSFMSGSFTEEGYTKTYAQAFIDAAKEANVSSVHLASRALQEMGTTMSSAASGTVEGYEGYYNFYNIGAYSGEDNYLKGLEYAKNNGWSSRQKAITGGAFVIGNNYIAKGQDTIYFQKFNVSGNRKLNAYTHQYMTNIMAPTSEASKIFDSYKSSNKLTNSYTFTIPVFEGMPQNAFKVSRTDTVGGTEEVKPEEVKPEENKPVEPPKPVIKPEQKVKDAGYSLDTGYLTKITYNSDVSEIKAKFNNLGYGASVVNSAWASKVTGKVSTGDKLAVDDKVYEIVVYGDPSGDGAATIKDLLLVQKYLLGAQGLDGVYKEAADVSKDKAVTIKDLLLIQKYLLGTGSIDQ